jgi:hypothetical protein
VEAHEEGMPGHVNRLADIGMCCSCFLPRKLENAPVGDPNSSGGGGGGSSGFLIVLANRSSPIVDFQQASFAGSAPAFAVAVQVQVVNFLRPKEQPDDLTIERCARKLPLMRLTSTNRRTIK